MISHLWGLRHSVAEQLWNASISATVILSLTLAGSLALGRARAATRHFLWFSAVCSLLCLLSISILPKWPTQGLPAPGAYPRELLSKARFSSIQPNSSIPVASPHSQPQSSISPAVVQPQPPIDVAPRTTKVDWDVIFACGWIAGALLFGLRASIGYVQLRKLRRCAHEPSIGERELCADVAREMAVSRRVSLLISNDPIMPMTWGWRRPVIMLPHDGRHWPQARMRLVLAHEFAHIRRKDTLSQGLLMIACAFYWFHPLIWWAAHRMRIEREQACDDLVLAMGTRPSDYAGHLLEIALQTRSVAGAMALRMAMPGQLESRLRAIVADGKTRGRLRRIVALPIVTASVGLILMLSGRGVASESKANDEIAKTGQGPDVAAAHVPGASDSIPAQLAIEACFFELDEKTVADFGEMINSLGNKKLEILPARHNEILQTSDGFGLHPAQILATPSFGISTNPAQARNGQKSAFPISVFGLNIAELRVAKTFLIQHHATALAIPKVTTQSGHLAHIEVPNGGSGSAIDSRVSSALGEGIQLDLTPVIAPDRKSIKMTVVSEVTTRFQKPGVPVYNRCKLSHVCFVKSGQTAVIGQMPIPQESGATNCMLVFVTPMLIDAKGNL